MDLLQEQFEQGVGDRFASWISAAYGDPCIFLRRADRAPDLVYSYRGRELFIEITAAYYDGRHAKFLWKGAKNAPDAPASWWGENPDKSLASAVSTRVAEKAKKAYGANTALLIEVPPGVTSAERLEELLSTQVLPDTNFAGIFVVGTFPMTTSSAGGYRVLSLKPFLQSKG
ncbi:hypothetical protein LPB67_09785 [Undibacterium sp. Jales W-56]|uniref:hypothetical protein n=1 Tax=Undibacterium sp. Jales W-56 TaxID=2897325 RepID=UPI0021D1C64E|nr:hypothetical protein [Undibacterium sp. Jales W-56]MCU6434056.1 hypothetical protein [Undibacterium sp. Jales W-56]